MDEVVCAGAGLWWITRRGAEPAYKQRLQAMTPNVSSWFVKLTMMVKIQGPRRESRRCLTDMYQH